MSSLFCLKVFGVKSEANAEGVVGGGIGWVIERGRFWAKNRERFQSVFGGG